MKRELLLRRFGIFMFLMEIKLNHNPENKPKLKHTTRSKMDK